MLALILTLLCAAPANADLGSELVSAVAQHKSEIAAAKTLPTKLRRLRALKTYLDDAAERLPAATANRDERRQLIIAVETLRVYFSKIDEKRVRAGDCELLRDVILMTADPRNDPPRNVPGEAREALDVLELVCPTARSS